MDEGPVFELEIERVRTRYRARVRQSPAGAQGWRSFSLPPDDDAGPAPEGGPPRHLLVDDLPQSMEPPKDFGRRLFEAIFAGPVLAAWRVALAQGDLLLRLRLDNDPRLLRVPWELLLDPELGTFVATRLRVVRVLDLPLEARSLKRAVPLRILVVLSSPPDVPFLDTKQEWSVLQEAFGAGVELQLVPPNLDEVDHALQTGRWHVLHFVGHGGMSEDGGFLILEGHEGHSRPVGHLHAGTFLNHPSLRLVVLNACEGARPGPNDGFSGVAQALVRRGVPAVVAMQQPVSDRAAIAFSRSFYRALAGKATVGAAVQQARRDLFRDEEAEWAIPVLYLNGIDEPLVKSRPWNPLLFAALTVVLLIALFGLALWRWAPSPTPRPPRGSGQNPPECPSPPRLNMAFVRIEAGTFTMGEEGAKDTEPSHQVTITRPFCIGVYEVTQEQWAQVFKSLPPSGRERYEPVHGVKYDAAEDFVRLLNEKNPAHPYRLPTEAEWEYVARGKSRMTYSFMDDAADLVHYANCGGRGDGFRDLTWVGQFRANPMGAHDMYGNVFEWVSDWYGAYSREASTDPPGPLQGDRRIRRGGSWKSGADACSSAARSVVKPDRKDQETGFRIVREIS